jgi:hypothetical protein
MNTENPELGELNLAAIIRHAADLVADQGLVAVVNRGGQVGALLARQNDAGARAWTLEAAGASLGLELPETLACFALWHGAYTAWTTHAADLRLGELAAGQLELVP